MTLPCGPGLSCRDLLAGSLALFLGVTALYLFASTALGIFLATLARSTPQFGLLAIPVIIPAGIAPVPVLAVAAMDPPATNMTNATSSMNPAPTNISTDMNRTHGFVPASCARTPCESAELAEKIGGCGWLAGEE